MRRLQEKISESPLPAKTLAGAPVSALNIYTAIAANRRKTAALIGLFVLFIAVLVELFALALGLPPAPATAVSALPDPA